MKALTPKSNPGEMATAVAVKSPHSSSIHEPASAVTGSSPCRADQLVQLAHMRESLRILAEEIHKGLQLVLAAQRQEGWPDHAYIEDETHGILMEAGSLHSLCLEYQTLIAVAGASCRRA